MIYIYVEAFLYETGDFTHPDPHTYHEEQSSETYDFATHHYQSPNLTYLENASESCNNYANRYLRPPVKFTLDSRRYPAPACQDPLTIFTPMINMDSLPALRWVQMDPAGGSKHAVLIYTSGSGLPDVGAGCGITISPDGRGEYSFPLERVGPEPLTSNRAELRAAHAALGLRLWHGEGFEKVVIATDSTYLVSGVNRWVIRWKNKKWRKVKNKDLWLMLLAEMEALETSGIVVQFYLIENKFNLAKQVARKGAVGQPCNIFVYFR